MTSFKTLDQNSAQFPNVFRDISTPVRKLYYRGDLAAIDGKKITIVGTRKPTDYGLFIAGEIARIAAIHGVSVISGLALGIDIKAHSAALDSGGKTIAILPSGLQAIYPARHQHIAERIGEHGLLLSEYEQSMRPMKHTFHERNRLLAALGDIVIVVEGSNRSGTRITAQWALEFGKAVFAVPGQINQPQSFVPNELIVQGAVPLTKPSGFLQELGIRFDSLPEYHTRDNQIREVLSTIQSGQTNYADVLDHCGLTAQQFNVALTTLEMDGAIQVQGGKIQQKRKLA